MRVSEDTFLYENENVVFLINFAAGSVDIVGPVLAERTREASKKGSFNESTAPFEKKTLEYLNNHNYVTSLTPREEKRERKRKIEKRRANAKIRDKRATILLSSRSGTEWCHSGREKKGLRKNFKLDKSSGDRVLTSLRRSLKELEGRKVVELDIWIDFPRYKGKWEDIFSILKSSDFSISRVWTETDSRERNEVEEWARANLFPAGISLALDYTDGGPGDYYLMRPQQEIRLKNLFSNNLRALFEDNSAYFLCPFIYDTFFVAGDRFGYCPAQLKKDAGMDGSSSSEETEENFPDLDSETGYCDGISDGWKLRALCDSTCKRFTEMFGEKETTIKFRLEKILQKMLENMTLTPVKEKINS